MAPLRTPKDWFVAGHRNGHYSCGVDDEITWRDQVAVRIESVAVAPDGFGCFMQTCAADAYRGKRVAFSAEVRSLGIEDRAGLWMRIDGPSGSVPNRMGFDNMHHRPIRGDTDWARYQVVLDVPVESATLNFGILLAGPGRVWISAPSIEPVTGETPVTCMGSVYITRAHPSNLDFVN